MPQSPSVPPEVTVPPLAPPTPCVVLVAVDGPMLVPPAASPVLVTGPPTLVVGPPEVELAPLLLVTPALVVVVLVPMLALLTASVSETWSVVFGSFELQPTSTDPRLKPRATVAATACRSGESLLSSMLLR